MNTPHHQKIVTYVLDVAKLKEYQEPIKIKGKYCLQNWTADSM